MSNTTEYVSIRKRVIRHFTNGIQFDNELMCLIGCDLDYFYRYIESNAHPSMNVDNMGTVWTISYVLTDYEAGSFVRRVNYRNFFPLFKSNPKCVKSRATIPAELRDKRKMEFANYGLYEITMCDAIVLA
jgi:hypothetical protein